MSQVVTIRPRRLTTSPTSEPKKAHVPVPPLSLIPSKTISYQVDLPLPSTELAPDTVKATYTTDLNIIKIHEAIAAKFASLRGKVPSMRRHIEENLAKISSGRCTHVEMKNTVAENKTLEEAIETFDTGTRWNKYITAVKPILDAYIPLISDEVKGIISIKSRSKTESKSKPPDTIVEKRVALIQQYLDIAGEYITLDIIHHTNHVPRCPKCDILFSDIPYSEDEGIHICECGYERNNLSKGPSFKDSLRVNVGGRNEYEDRETFERAFSRMEGTYPDKIPALLYEQLDKYFTSKGFYGGEEIRAMSILPNGRKPHTSVAMMIDALKETGNPEFYKCYTLICHNYWGWALRDFTAIRAQVMQDYDATQPIYNIIKERDSSLNVNIRVYLQLKAVDYPIELDDIKCLIARESLVYHQRMWRIMCDRTGVKYTDII